MNTIYLILYILAFVCFLIAAFGQTLVSRINIMALGLAFWVLVPLVMLAKSL